MEQAQHSMREACDRTSEMVTNNPASSALLTFGLGFGVGLVLTSMMRQPRHRMSWYESHMPNWANREHFMEMVSRMMPEAVSKRM